MPRIRPSGRDRHPRPSGSSDERALDRISGVTTLSCGAGYGSGGLGRHFAQLIEEARGRGELEAYYCPSPQAEDAAGHQVHPRAAGPALAYTPIRFSPGWRTYVGGELFDRSVARCIQRTERHVGFSGQTLRTFEAVKTDTLELVSPTAHVDRLTERYSAAFRAYPVERPWLNEAGRRKALAEYRRADVIHVASEYARESFLEAGVPPEKLLRVHLTIPDRFRPAPGERDDETFRVLYVGSLTVTKGVPVLLEAFRRLPGAAELVLVGGWGTRGMRRHVQSCLAADPRIRVVSGEPLAELRQADVLVHPSFSEGFGYAPMEALACGVPVVVTEDTGMKEHVREGVNGWVVPTGNADVLLERLAHLRRHPRSVTDIDGSRD
jgi:glycosyltransferase involved in cell wall biosynthesis